MLNQALSDQMQAIWIGKFCFPMQNKSLFMQANSLVSNFFFSLILQHIKKQKK
jgi:hypothetical protein